jgi:hypothetical protein
VGPRAGLDDVKENFLTLPGLELRPLDGKREMNFIEDFFTTQLVSQTIAYSIERYDDW